MATVTQRGTGTHNASSPNPWTLVPASNFAAGAKAVLCITGDNASSGGATNDLTSVTDSLSNTWTKRTAAIYDNGAASAGIQGSIFETDQNGGTLTTGSTISVTHGVAAVAKGWSIYEIAPAAGKKIVYGNAGVGTGATTTTPTVTTDSAAVGDIIVGVYHSENVNATTGDSDTSNGSWTAQATVTVGTGTSGIWHSSQTKITTGAAGTQTFNPTTATSQDCVLSWARFVEASNATGTAAISLAKPSLAAAGAEKFRGTAAATIAKPALAASGAEKFSGTAAPAFAKPGLAASGTVTAAPITGTGAITFAKPGFSASGAETFSGIAAAAFARPALAATGGETFAGTGAVAWTKPALAVSGTATFSGSANIAFGRPSFAASGTAGEQGYPPTCRPFRPRPRPAR